MPWSSPAKPPRPTARSTPTQSARPRSTAGRPGPGLGVPAGCAADRGRRARTERACAVCARVRATPRLPRRLAELSGRPGRCSSTSGAGGEATTGTPGTRAARDAAPRRGAARAGCWCRAATARVLPGEVGLALRGGHTTAEPVDDARAGTTERASAGRPGRGGRGVRGGTPLELLLDRGGRPLGAAQRRPRRARPQGDRRCCTSTSGPRRCWSRSPRPPACSRPRADAGGNPVWLPDRRVRRLGAASRPPSAGPELARAWLDSPRMPGWSAPATPPARRGTRSPPSWPARTMVETRADDAGRAGRAARRRGASPPAPASRRWSRRVALAAAAPARGRRADQVAWTVDRGRGARGHRARRAGVVRPGPARRRRRKAATAALAGAAARAGRPRAAPGRPDRGRARAAGVASWPGGCSWSPTSSRAAARPSTASPRPRSAGRSTPAGPRPRCTTSSASVSRTPVPQPLTYLVDDTARTFGTVRVGHAEAFLRADDEAALDRAAAPPEGRHPRAAPARTDGAGQHDAARRAAAPAARARRRARRRGGGRHRPRRPPRRAAGPAPRASTAAGGRRGRPARPPASPRVVTAIRAGDRAAPSRPPARRAALTPAGSLAALREAVEAGAPVLIGYVDNHGTSTERIVDPVSRRGRRADRPRPPHRRHPHASPSTGSPRSRTRSRASEPSVDSDGGLHPVRRARRPALLNADALRRRRALARYLADREWLHDQCTDRDCMLLRKFQRELRPVFEASGEPATRPPSSTGSTR